MKRRKLLLFPLLGLIALTSLCSCGEDRWKEYYPLTGRDLWIDSLMREVYLWYEDIPPSKGLNYFQNPETFLKSILSKNDKGFSTVDTIMDTPLPSYGFDYTLYKVATSDTTYNALVSYVANGSPAAEAGLQRGNWIMLVDGDSITKKTEERLTDGGTRTLRIGKYVIVKDEDGKDVIVTQTGTKLANIGKMTIHTDGTISTELISEVVPSEVNRTYTVQKNDSLSRIAKRELGSYDRWREIYDSNRDKISDPGTIYPGMVLTIRQGSVVNENGRAVDPDTHSLIEQIKGQFNETLKTPLGSTAYKLTIKDEATGERRIRNGETNLGDLAADAYRVQLGADIGLCNGGGVRTDIESGTITYEDTLAVFPFGNMGCVAEVTGQQIKDALEMGAKNYPEESGGFMHVSGLTYTIDSSVKSSIKVDDKGNFVSVDGPYRVTDILVGGQPIDLNKTYTVASHNYMLKSGGDGMTMFNGCNIIKDEVMVDVDVLSTYIQGLGGSVSSEYENSEGQGRIVIR